MSKKNKGQKLETTLFFHATSTAVPDAPPPSNDRPYGRFDRPMNPRYQGGMDNEVNWRRPNMIESFDSNDKFSKAFSAGAPASVGAWRPRTAPVENDVRKVESIATDKWSNAFSKVSEKQATSSNVSAKLLSGENGSKNNTATISAPAPQEQKKANNRNEQKENLRKAQESKKSAASIAAAQRDTLLDREKSTYAIAQSCVETGLKGDELKSHILVLGEKPYGSALLESILSQLSDPCSLKWPLPSEYGPALNLLLAHDVEAQGLALDKILTHCYAQKFPKVMVKDSPRNLIEVIFQLCYQHEIIEQSTFSNWMNDESDIEGKEKALFQTVDFINFLKEESDGEEEEDDYDIDAPLPTVP